MQKSAFAYMRCSTPVGLRRRRNDTASNLQMLRILRQCKSPHSHICVALLLWDCGAAAMTLRRICKCSAFFANAKVRIRIYALRTFAFAGAARLQILPCGRSGEICSGREPSVPLGGTVMPRTRNSRAAARLHGTVSSRHGDHAKTADSHTRESALQRRCSAIKKPHLQTRFSLVGVARFELAALRSRTVRATKLRYTPKLAFSLL